MLSLGPVKFTPYGLFMCWWGELQHFFHLIWFNLFRESVPDSGLAVQWSNRLEQDEMIIGLMFENDGFVAVKLRK